MRCLSHRALGLVLLLAAGATTPLTAQTDIPKPEHPEPMAVREAWKNLNGPWEFRFDTKDEGLAAGWFKPGAEGFDKTITVPFPWESKLSGIQDTSGDSKIGWYRRTLPAIEGAGPGKRTWLHFGAVDWNAQVWVNGQKVAEHDGGYTPFAADITDALADGENTLVVRAFDATDPNLPVGKQVGWYTPSSGIWQTVWLEARSSSYINDFFIKPEIDPAQVTIDLSLTNAADGMTISVRPENETVGSPSAPVEGGKARVVVPVSDPHIWYPEVPYLYDIHLDLKDKDGQVVDSVKTYFALRTVARGKHPTEDFECILLNGRPQYIRAALDQSFNPEGLYTAPSDDYMQRDLFLAKYHGLNCLRIHIKPEEPRRLYWADRAGILIMEDMPNSWRQNPTAREAWESTMREVIKRDKNHPSIWSWIAFNETWGLGSPDEYKKNTDTQQWVNRMVDEIRKLDSTRLVEDMSPCNYDHISNTDLNSWHFYIDDYQGAEAHIKDVVERTQPGSDFNYVPGQKQTTAPLINSEYGNVSAGGGDRDISWGFRHLTNSLRKHNKIQGYVYTELTDIEWEHNGFNNYDRSPKDFYYDAFLPDMRPNELNGADFVGYDAPPAIVAKPGETIEVPVFISHYSTRPFEPKLRWWLQGWDESGDENMISPPTSIPATWAPYEVTWQEPIKVKVPDYPFVGALILTLRDPNNHRFAANYVNVVVRPEKPQPRAQRLNDHDAILRFNPEDYASSKWSAPADAPAGKVYGRGTGFFEYRLKVPEVIAQAGPDVLFVNFEASSKADRERVDWPERTSPQDYPQTDVREYPSTLRVSVNGHVLATEELATDGGDARGVLSHLAGVEHGSRGDVVNAGGLPLPAEVRQAIARGEPLVIRLEVPEDALHPGGLAIYGPTTGQYPAGLSVEIHTERPMPADLGVDPEAPVAFDTVSSRRVAVLADGSAGNAAHEWKYTTTEPAAGWNSADFDASSWSTGPAGFGTRGTPGVRVQTNWDTPAIWLRTTVDLPELGADDVLTLRLFHDENAEIFVNGQPLLSADGYITDYQSLRLTPEQKALFRPGQNVIAVSCRQRTGGQGIDLGLGLLKAQ